jgi:hypothetical protein
MLDKSSPCLADRLLHFPQMCFFSAATMMTLGFGNINAARESYFGMFVVLTNLMTGYGLLAVLVTRLAIMFQTMAPGYVPKIKASGEPPESEYKRPPNSRCSPLK